LLAEEYSPKSMGGFAPQISIEPTNNNGGGMKNAAAVVFLG
jgi:hypothetical protein